MVVYSLFYILQNKKGTDLVLGVDAHGINIYEPNDVKKPKITFPWNEVQNVAYNDKKVGFTTSVAMHLHTCVHSYR